MNYGAGKVCESNVPSINVIEQVTVCWIVTGEHGRIDELFEMVSGKRERTWWNRQMV